MIDKFNVRVYGLLVKGQKILVSLEQIDELHMCKFPGGGLEFGEGLKDAMIREIKEELGIIPISLEQWHISEDFVQSKLRVNEQVLAVYYRLWTDEEIVLDTKTLPTAFGSENQMKLEWRNLDDTLIEDLSFETDKEAVRKLIPVINRGDELSL